MSTGFRNSSERSVLETFTKLIKRITLFTNYIVFKLVFAKVKHFFIIYKDAGNPVTNAATTGEFTTSNDNMWCKYCNKWFIATAETP